MATTGAACAAIVDEADVRAGKIPVDRAGRLHGLHGLRERLCRQCDEPAAVLPVRPAPAGKPATAMSARALARRSRRALGADRADAAREQPIEEFEVDGVRMIFQNTPNTEAPSEMNTYLPEMKALWMAENVIAIAAQHLHPARRPGARSARPGRNISTERSIASARRREVMFASHHWPRWGNDRDPGGAARPARPVRQHEQPGAPSRQPGRDDQRDPQCLRAAEEPAGASGTAAATTARRNTTPAAWCSAISASGTATRRPSSRCRRAIRAALRRDDGRRREDHGARPRAARRGQIPARHRDPQ